MLHWHALLLKQTQICLNLLTELVRTQLGPPDCERRIGRNQARGGGSSQSCRTVLIDQPLSPRAVDVTTPPAPSRSTSTLVTNYQLLTYVIYLDEPSHPPSSLHMGSTLLPLRLMTPTGFVCFRLLYFRLANEGQMFSGQDACFPFFDP